MNDVFLYLSNHAGLVLQGIVLLCVNMVLYYVNSTSSAIKDLQREIKEQNEKFKDYMTNERCEYHRKILEAHMARTDTKLAEFAKQCKKRCGATCKAK